MGQNTAPGATQRPQEPPRNAQVDRPLKFVTAPNAYPIFIIFLTPPHFDGNNFEVWTLSIGQGRREKLPHSRVEREILIPFHQFGEEKEKMNIMFNFREEEEKFKRKSKNFEKEKS